MRRTAQSRVLKASAMEQTTWLGMNSWTTYCLAMAARLPRKTYF